VKVTESRSSVPTQTRRSFAAMNMANAADALLIKSGIEEKSVQSAANERKKR